MSAATMLVRIPYMTRVRISYPCSSVPKGCWAEGAESGAPARSLVP